MPPRSKSKTQGGSSATLYRFLALAALLACGLGVRTLLGVGLKAFGGGGGGSVETDPSAFETEPVPIETAAEAKTPQEFVERSLAENRVIIFSKSYCGFSMRGKAVLRKHLGDEGFKVVELDKREDGPALQDELLRITGGRTVPRIFVDGKFIGGADDVTAKDASGELGTLLRDAGLLSAV